MRPCRVVVGDPGADELAGVIEVEEQALVEEFVAHAAVDALYEAVLLRFAWRDVSENRECVEWPTDFMVKPLLYLSKGGSIVAINERNCSGIRAPISFRGAQWRAPQLFAYAASDFRSWSKSANICRQRTGS